MRKTSIILIVSIIINIFSSVTIYAEGKNETELEFVKEKIASITEELGMSEDNIDKYLSEYDKTNDFVYDLIKYKKYLEHNIDKEISFEDFKAGVRLMAEETFPNKMMQLDNNTEGIVSTIPENSIKDYTNYASLNPNEKLNYSTGELMYEEDDLVLPGVNGLDLVLTSRFIQEESAMYAPSFLAIFREDCLDREECIMYYKTYMTSYTSSRECQHGIGAGWGFALPNVYEGEYNTCYISLRDGSNIKAEYNESTGVFDLIGRGTKDITFKKNKWNDYMVTYKDGICDFFGENGITKTVDRYGNSIQYFYSDDGLLSKIIDSAGRIITIERSYGNVGNVAVKVDGELMCSYTLEKYTRGRYKLTEKVTNEAQKYYFYNDNKVAVQLPATMYADENYLLTLQEVANLTDNYSSEYTYELGGMAIEGNGSNGRKSFPRLKSRKDKGIVSNYGMSANEKVYEYDGAVGFTEYTMSETTVQTGAKTEYTSNVLRQITNKRSSLPDSDLTIETNYSYDKYRLLESYEQKTYNSSGSYSVTESYEHDEKGNLISHTDKFGTQRQYSYDDATSVIANIEEPISRYGYSSMRYTTNELDPNGSIIKTSIMDQIKNIAQTTEYTYDTYGNILSSKSLPAYMAEEIFEYTDDHANIKRLIKGDRVTAEYEYDNIGRKISETNALGQTTKYKYSFRGDLVEVINPDHTNTKNLYSSDLGSIYETNIYCDEKGPVKKETIDDFGRVTSVSEISVLESENTYNNQYNYEDFYEDESKFFDIFTLDGWQTKENIRYDSIGRVTEVSNVNGTTKYEYDGFNRIIKKINPDLSEQRIEYDDIERTRTVYDEEGNKTIEKYDAENRVISQTIFPNENTPVSNSFSYDREGQLAMIVDYNGNTTGYHYDTLGRKTETENALGERSYKKYASDMSYDAEYYFDGTVRQMNYYDEFGRLSAVTDEYFNVNTYAYDAGDNLIESIDKNGNSIRYKYNSRNAVTNISTNGAEKEYTYDEAGKTRAIESRRANSSGILDKENRIQYNYRRNGLVNDETDSRLDGIFAKNNYCKDLTILC